MLIFDLRFTNFLIFISQKNSRLPDNYRDKRGNLIRLTFRFFFLRSKKVLNAKGATFYAKYARLFKKNVRVLMDGSYP